MRQYKIASPWALAAIAAVATISGCASIRSTHYEPDGCHSGCADKKHLKGVPTTLDVPAFLQVSIKRTRFGTANEHGFVTFVPELEDRTVEVEVKKQTEIFGVDFKRPAAGSLAYKIGFGGEKTNGQYIKSVDNLSNDNTIASVTNLVTTILGTIPPVKKNVRDVAGGESKLLPFEEVIACEVFAINEPGCQNRVQAFIDTYLNSCHDCNLDRAVIVKPVAGAQLAPPVSVETIPAR